MTEPSSFEEVVEDTAWVDTMVEEYDSIVRNSAWEIVPGPKGKSMVGSRWIYKVRQRSDGLFVSQGKYAREILEKFNMHGGKHVLRYLRGTSGYGFWYR